MSVWENPIIRGYHPDPSICRVGEDYYLVHSSFEFFPGVPIYHSKNLVDWELIGHCLTRKGQLPLTGCRPSAGIYAPTIRYHDGLFYVITTNVSGGGNFLVTASDPAGEWSDPVWIDQEGIDPSLFFDDDQKVYYCGTGEDANGKQGIVGFELDVKTGRILSKKKILTYGSGGRFPEGPHLYKLNGYYYLMLAEGGTEYGHMETILRSRSVWGPYESCPHNPILSNRDEMYNNIQCTGHADLCEDPQGNWWMVCLAVRKLPSGQMLHNLGRETCLTSVIWDDAGWPHAAMNGTIQPKMEGPLPVAVSFQQTADFCDSFTQTTLHPEWTFVRNPVFSRYETGSGALVLHGNCADLSDDTPTFVGVRQTEFVQSATVTVSACDLLRASKAGLSAFYSAENHYDCYLLGENGHRYVAVSRRVMDNESVTAKILLPDDLFSVILRIAARMDAKSGAYDYWFEVKLGDRFVAVDRATAAGLCTEGTKTMTFTGVFYGVFAVSCDASFTDFRLETERS